MCVYLSVNPRKNEIRLNQWVSVGGRKTRQYLALKTYEQPAQAKEVLQAAGNGAWQWTWWWRGWWAPNEPIGS